MICFVSNSQIKFRTNIFVEDVKVMLGYSCG